MIIEMPFVVYCLNYLLIMVAVKCCFFFFLQVSEITSSSSSDEGYRELSPTEVGTPIFDLNQLEQSDSGISSNSNSSKSIWELALNFEPSKHYTWEVVGK